MNTKSKGEDTMKTYGYCRISRKTQNIERQVRNIKDIYPEAHVICEAYTGTKLQGRKELDKLLKILKPGDKLVFDSASRMSRNAAEAVQLYEELYSKGIVLEFLKEPHINTEVYRAKLAQQIEIHSATGSKSHDNLINGLVKVLNQYTIDLAKEQVEIVFNQAQKEVDDLHQRTSEGLTTAKMNGKQIGQPKGAKLITKKSLEAKATIKKFSKDFDGQLNDPEAMKLTGLARNTYYKYKRELKEAGE